jgi:heat shock protein HslJ
MFASLVRAETQEPELRGPVWQLQQVEYSNDETITTGDPDRYTLEFGEDNLILLRADCNHGTGTYQQNESQLDLELGILTRAQCPPDSFADQYLRDLEFVTSYVFEQGDLFLSLQADGGIMQFSAQSQDLVGPVWSLAEMIYADYTIVITKLGQYTLSFDEEEGVSIQADCNRALGTFTQTEQEISILLGPTTLAACPPTSLAEPFTRSLTQPLTYFVQGDQLQMTSEAKDLTLVFEILEDQL